MKAISIISAGTGADLNIPLGFVPDHVKIINATTFDVNEMWADSATIKINQQMDASDGVVTTDTDGILMYAGNDGSDGNAKAAKGITLDASALSNVNEKVLVVIAETYV